MDNKKIIEKIKKLLELSTSPNENEATLAMEQAQRLMLKHSIEQDQFYSTTNETEVIKNSEYWNPVFKRQGVLEQMPSILAIITPIFGVHSLIIITKVPNSLHQKEVRYELYGFETNIEIARFALDSILAQGLLEVRAEYKKYRTTLFGLSFWTGFKDGLAAKFLPLQNSSETGIEVYDKVKSKRDEFANGTLHSQNYDGVALKSGYEAGLRAQLRKGLEQTGNKGNLLK